MSQPLVSFVVAFRNRDPQRIANLFQSIAKQTQTSFEFLVTDYGSNKATQITLEAVADRLGFRILRVEAQGLPWNKSLALNVAVRASRGSWIVVVDADMVLHGPAVDFLVTTAGENELWLLESLWPQGPRRNPFKGRRHRSPGVFQMFRRFWYENIHGYCEDFEFWGSEDSDFVWRMQAAGCSVRWLTADRFLLTHSWHPKENNSVTRPLTAIHFAHANEVRNGWRPYQNSDWGKTITPQERPILSLMETASPVEIVLSDCSASEALFLCREHLKKGVLIHFVFGDRIPRRLLTKLAPVFLRLQDGVALFSLALDYRVQAHLETFLHFRAILGPGNCDVFLTEDLKSGYLCLK